MRSMLFVGCMMPGWVIQWSYWIAWSGLAVAAALSVGCFTVEVHRRRFRWLLLYAALLALQPGWSLLSREELLEGVMHVRADCGFMGRALSLFLLTATLAVSVLVWRRPAVRRRTFIFCLAVAFTFMNLVGELLPYSGLTVAIPHDLYASVFSGFGGPPWFLLASIVVCALLFAVQRVGARKAV